MMLWWLSTSTAWACSGPGAEEAIARAEWGGTALAVFTVLLMAGATYLARQRGAMGRALAGGYVLLLAHPGWWMSARGGDCGEARLDGALLFTFLAAGIGVWSAIRPESAEGPAGEGPSSEDRGAVQPPDDGESAP